MKQIGFAGLLLLTAAFAVVSVPAQGKRNERAATPTVKPAPETRKTDPDSYLYVFKQPEFQISRTVIKHGEDGVGSITFERSDASTEVTEPLKVSEAALQRINAALTELDFIRSDENYQFEKDYSHLGTVTFTRRAGTRTRTVTLNFTENKKMRAVLDEYRRMGQQAIWIFDVGLARDNQPLETPGLMDVLDSLVKRGEISDPLQLLPFLKELSQDERLPLIARNKASRTAQRIEKGLNGQSRP